MSINISVNKLCVKKISAKFWSRLFNKMCVLIDWGNIIDSFNAFSFLYIFWFICNDHWQRFLQMFQKKFQTDKTKVIIEWLFRFEATKWKSLIFIDRRRFFQAHVFFVLYIFRNTCYRKQVHCSIQFMLLLMVTSFVFIYAYCAFMHCHFHCALLHCAFVICTYYM